MIRKITLTKMELQQYNTKEKVIALVKKRPCVLRDLDPIWQDDDDVVMSAVKVYGAALEFASLRLRANKKIVIEAIKTYPRALMFASRDFRDNDKIREYAFYLYGAVFIVDPDAWTEFEYQDRVLSIGGADSINLFQRLHKKFYGFGASMTADEIKELERELLEIKQLHNKRYKCSVYYDKNLLSK